MVALNKELIAMIQKDTPPSPPDLCDRLRCLAVLLQQLGAQTACTAVNEAIDRLTEQPQEPADVRAALVRLCDLAQDANKHDEVLALGIIAAVRTIRLGIRVDAAMVERALTERARREDGARWPDAYSDEEREMERENMRSALIAALNPPPDARLRQRNRAMADAITTGPDWLPIESAPKDGRTEILLHESGHTFIGIRPVDCPDDAAADLHGIACYPSHWRPIPQPPITSPEDTRHG